MADDLGRTQVGITNAGFNGVLRLRGKTVWVCEHGHSHPGDARDCAISELAKWRGRARKKS